MTRRIRVIPYKQGSRSAKALAQALGGKVLKLQNSKYVWRPGDLVINWGNSELGGEEVLNPGYGIKDVANKLLFFNKMKELGLEDILPEFWTNASSIPDEAFPVVCRTILSGHSGVGVHIANSRDELVHAPLYVKYIKKKDEYRVHVGIDNEDRPCVISVQRKAKRNGIEPVCYQIRNLANGFVYVREGVNPPNAVIEAAKQVLQASFLDFGAVDVIWNEHYQRAYVLEINSAPGLEGQTVTDYANFFMENF